MSEIRVLNAKADVVDGGEKVMRGILDPECLKNVTVAEYQRESLIMKDKNALMTAYAQGGVDDIQLGVRGEMDQDKFLTDDTYVIDDVVAIVDGLQRITVAREMVDNPESASPHVGAILRFNSTEEIERVRFEIANWKRVNVAPAVRYRNARHVFPVMTLLYNLSMDEDFPLYKRICWNQRKGTNDLIGAPIYVATCSALHAHMGAARVDSFAGDAMMQKIQSLYEKIGPDTLRQNVETYFEVIDFAWGIRNITLKVDHPHLNRYFLASLAQLFSEHFNFWRGDKLTVVMDDRRKLKLFNTADPAIARMTGSGSARVFILDLLKRHINSGRRGKTRLISRDNELLEKQEFSDDGVEGFEDTDEDVLT